MTGMLPTAKQAIDHIKTMLIQALRDASESGEFLTYEKLSEIIGGDAQKPRYRYYVNQAREAVQNEYGVLFEPVRGKGLKPLLPEQSASTIGSDARRKIKSVTNQWRSKFDSIPVHKLTSQGALQSYVSENLRLTMQERLSEKSTDLKIEAASESAIPGDHHQIKQALFKAYKMME